VQQGLHTRPFAVQAAGQLVPLVGVVGRDGFGQLALRLVYSEHLGLDALRPHAFNFGMGRNGAATENELAAFARNVQFTWSILSMPVHNARDRGTIHGNEFVAHTRSCADEVGAMCREGIIVDTGRRISLGFLHDLPIMRFVG